MNLLAAAFAVFAVSGVAAQSFATQSFGGADGYQAVQRYVEAAYHDALAEYDAAIAENPGDVLLQIQRCEVIEAFAYGEEFYVESAAELAETCMDVVFTFYPGNLEVELERIERDYDDGVTARADRLHATRIWTGNRAHHARLEKLRSEKQLHFGGNERLAAFYCVKALDLDLAADCRLLAADYYLSRDNIDAATDILVSPLDANTDPYHVLRKIQKLAGIDASAAIETLLARLDPASFDDWLSVDLATALTDAGLPERAMSVLDGISTDYWDPATIALTRYRLALAMTDYEQALVHYNALRDTGFEADPLLRIRFGLMVRDVSLPWRLRDLAGLLAMTTSILLLIGFASVVPAVVHYRGLVREKRGLAAGADDGVWTLRHAWYGLFILVFGEFFVLYVFEYELLESFLFGAGWQASEVDLPRLLIAQVFLFGLLLLPLLRGRGRLAALGSGEWSVWKCLWVGFAAAIAFRLLFAVPTALLPEELVTGESFSTLEAITQTYRKYGFWFVFLLVAVLVPLVEECLFRGVLLQGFSRHVGFRWANVIQSAIFAAVHEQLALMPFYFALAYVAGLLVRRAGGLLPVLVLHAVFNGSAVLALVVIDFVLDGIPLGG